MKFKSAKFFLEKIRAGISRVPFGMTFGQASLSSQRSLHSPHLVVAMASYLGRVEQDMAMTALARGKI